MLIVIVRSPSNWFAENNPEGVAFQYDVIGPPV
jgi:hypothetical protein